MIWIVLCLIGWIIPSVGIMIFAFMERDDWKGCPLCGFPDTTEQEHKENKCPVCQMS